MHQLSLLTSDQYKKHRRLLKEWLIIRKRLRWTAHLLDLIWNQFRSSLRTHEPSSPRCTFQQHFCTRIRKCFHQTVTILQRRRSWKRWRQSMTMLKGAWRSFRNWMNTYATKRNRNSYDYRLFHSTGNCEPRFEEVFSCQKHALTMNVTIHIIALYISNATNRN